MLSRPKISSWSERRSLADRRSDCVGSLSIELAGDRVEDLVLGRKVMVEGALRHASLSDDALHGRPVVPLRGEQLGSRLDQERSRMVEVSNPGHNIPTVGL